MYKEHPDFELPSDESLMVWRYLDLSKFMSLLETSSLYFTRSDKFIDPYEGTIPKITVENISKYFSEFENASQMQKDLLNLLTVNRKLTFINCWYQSEHESDAMWTIFSNNGIAIQTNIGNLKRSFDATEDDVRIGTVKYIDYNNEGMYFLNALTPFLFKRVSFEHEREIRAVIWNTRTTAKNKHSDKIIIDTNENGKFARIDLETLIEKIYVSPKAPSWFYELIKAIVNRYNLNKPVIHSLLYTIDDDSNFIHETTIKEIMVSKDVLDHFYKKDSYRINVENLKIERERFREFESFQNDLNSMRDELEKCVFKSRINYCGKDALLKFSQISYSKKEIDDLFNMPQFNTLYFLSGKTQTLLNDIESSILSEKEKKILTRKVIYFYSENVLQPATYLSVQIEKHNVKESAFHLFLDFTRFMSTYILESRI